MRLKNDWNRNIGNWCRNSARTCSSVAHPSFVTVGNRDVCRFVCFIGIDGSGKTTLAHSVMDALNQRGLNFRYVHGLIWPKLAKPFMAIGRFLFARGRSRESDYKEFSTAKRSSFSKYPICFPLYRIILSLDYVPQIFGKISMPLLFGRKIISDRYVYDMVLNIGLNVGGDVDEMIRSINRYFRVLPKPDVVFWVDVPEEVSFSRKDDVPCIEYLQERRGLYRKLADAFGMIVLDGTMSVEALTEIAIEVIQEGKPDNGFGKM